MSKIMHLGVSASGSTPVEDSLSSTNTQTALSANQGRVLNEKNEVAEASVNANWQGKGYNLIPFPYYSVSSTIRGVTFSVNDDGSVNINGTNNGASGDFTFIPNNASQISFMFHAEVGKKYTCVYEVDGTLPEGCFIAVNGYNDSAYVKAYYLSNNSSLNKPFIVTSDAPNLTVYITNRSGYVFNNVTVKVMLVEVDSNDNYPTKYQRYGMGNVELQNTIEGISGGDEWLASKAYSVNDYVIYQNKLYRCKANTTAGIIPTNTTYWEATSAVNELKNLEWKLAGQTTGNAPISLPANFKELNICLNISNIGNQNLRVIREELRSDSTVYRQGWSFNNANNLIGISVSLTSVVLSLCIIESVDKVSQTTIKVWYR